MKSLSLAILVSLFGCTNIKQGSNSQLIENEWNTLCSTQMCFAGSQHFGVEADKGFSFTTNKNWNDYLTNNRENIIPFLIDKLNSSSQTELHLCGCHNASEAEVAIFALETIVEKNWFEADSQYERLTELIAQRKRASGPIENYVLADKEGKSELIKFFMDELKK